MLEETETEEAREFFVAFLSLLTFRLGAGSLATPMCWAVCFRNKKSFQQPLKLSLIHWLVRVWIRNHSDKSSGYFCLSGINSSLDVKEHED